MPEIGTPEKGELEIIAEVIVTSFIFSLHFWGGIGGLLHEQNFSGLIDASAHLHVSSLCLKGAEKIPNKREGWECYLI